MLMKVLLIFQKQNKNYIRSMQTKKKKEKYQCRHSESLFPSSYFSELFLPRGVCIL